MPFPEKSDLPEYGKTMTAADLHQWYLTKNRLLSGEAIRAIVEPIAGSSFGRIALDALQSTFAEQKRNNVIQCMHPRDLYLAFFKHIDDTNIDNDLKGTEAMEAEIAAWSFLPYNVGMRSVYPDSRLESGEMALHQMRHDDVWHDEAHQQYAYTQGIAAWQFFRNGERLGPGLAIQWLYWQDWAGAHMVHILADGSPQGRQFFDGRVRGIAVLPKQFQAFKSYTNLLFFSDRFDFDQALRKAPPQRQR